MNYLPIAIQYTPSWVPSKANVTAALVGAAATTFVQSHERVAPIAKSPTTQE